MLGIAILTSMILASCGEATPPEVTVDETATDVVTEETTVSETTLRIVGEWNMTMTQDDQPGQTIATKGVFNPDGTAYTNYGAHYTISEQNIMVQADNGSTIMQGIILDAGHMNGTWTNNWTGKTGTWTAVR